ncbi:MAG: heavy metal-binding domain-containing protein [Bacteroidota bacterium]|nr:heavy metal-binding domain-containing protein [Bacteroidota bacterium]MDP4197233.1 heavy metal-binding domain-containing protein [Bacteroidota bacterium]
MKKSAMLLKVGLLVALMSVSYSGQAMAQEKGSKKTHEMQMQNNDKKSSSNKNAKSASSKDQSIIRKGVIDVNAIDKNKDGKVYQDQMDWNVISDKPGTCPLCKMTLEQVTIKKAKENLKANGFKVK